MESKGNLYVMPQWRASHIMLLSYLSPSMLKGQLSTSIAHKAVRIPPATTLHSSSFSCLCKSADKHVCACHAGKPAEEPTDEDKVKLLQQSLHEYDVARMQQCGPCERGNPANVRWALVCLPGCYFSCRNDLRQSTPSVQTWVASVVLAQALAGLI
eukprot:1152791-Pelagomonas_calceolata.AAC.2